MIIDKAGFYDLSGIKDSQIKINSGIDVNLFDSGEYSKNIFIEDLSIIKFYGIFTNSNNQNNIKFFQKGKDSKLFLNLLLYSNKTLAGNVYSEILEDNNESNLRILSIILNDSFINLDGVIRIKEGIKNAKCNLREENIFIGDNGGVIMSPKLLIESNDIKASHSCKVERYNKDKLFYLNSRGIGKNESIKLLLSSKFNSLFTDMDKINSKLFLQISKNFSKIT